MVRDSVLFVNWLERFDGKAYFLFLLTCILFVVRSSHALAWYLFLQCEIIALAFASENLLWPGLSHFDEVKSVGLGEKCEILVLFLLCYCVYLIRIYAQITS